MVVDDVTHDPSSDRISITLQDTADPPLFALSNFLNLEVRDKIGAYNNDTVFFEILENVIHNQNRILTLQYTITANTYY